MGDMLRSDPMTLCDIFIQPEAAFEILSQLGEIGCVQFLDLNSELQLFQRNYVTDVCRFAEMERKLRYFESEMIRENIAIPYVDEMPSPMQPNEMLTYETLFGKWEHDLLQICQNQTNLLQSFVSLTEMDYVLKSVGPLLGDAGGSKRESLLEKGKLIIGDLLKEGHLFVISGVVDRKRSFPFEMMLWRISRGNIYYRQASEDLILNDPQTGREIRKVAFLAICQGEELSQRMNKVCSGFRVNLYDCPDNFMEREELIVQFDRRVDDLQQVIVKAKFIVCKALRDIAKKWSSWEIQVKKSKAIYHTMNRFNFDITKKCLIGQCWVPDKDLSKVQLILENASKKIGTPVPSFMSRIKTDDTPPTYHRTNKFTRGFQTLINAYGTSTYRELNPGLYTIISFPFLFSLMFADLGHGLIVVIFAAWMLLNEKKFLKQKSTNEIWNIFFGGRYIILLLGLFSINAGLAYNDCFSVPMSMANPSWFQQIKSLTLSNEDLASRPIISLDPSLSKAYTIGIDPIWATAANHIMVTNSIKMKLSIIIGIIHMFFGTCLSLFNYIHFKEYHAIFFQFLPELIFLTCLFVWLVVLIYIKWILYNPRIDGKRGAGCAPAILILFIDMFLLGDTEPVAENCDALMFEAQKEFQTALIFIALFCIPIMLFGSPVYEMIQHKKKRKAAMMAISEFRRYRKDAEAPPDDIMTEVAKHSISFGDVFIHQAIHTIEYVLSTISHTASYLRLWALSLAHTSLSDMLWHMILSQFGFHDRSIFGAFKLVASFFVWALFTVSILVIMEGLSAFLHTLRLHWVEFMSKFYVGGGWMFQPFSFEEILDGDEDKSVAACKKFLDTDEV